MKNRGKHFYFRIKSHTKGQGGQTWLNPHPVYADPEKSWLPAQNEVKDHPELSGDTNKSSRFTENLALPVLTALGRPKGP